MYAQQLAWLHAVPKSSSKDKNEKPRFEKLDDDNPAKTLPEANGYLTMCFQLAGICSSGGMAITALTWSEIDSFIARSAYPLTGWESEQIISMSRIYVNFSHKAKDAGFPAPYNPAANDDDAMEAARSIVNNRFLAMLGPDGKK